MASPSDPSQTSALDTASGSGSTRLSLDIAPEMEALRAKRLEVYGEAEKPFDMERFYRLVVEKSPARLVETSQLGFMEALATTLTKLLEAEPVNHTDDIETHFAGKAVLTGLSRILLHDDITPERLEADLHDAARTVADKIMIHEQERKAKALKDQNKALRDQIKAQKDQAKAQKDEIKAQQDEIKALQEQIALANAR
jgi:hypothetical protein